MGGQSQSVDVSELVFTFCDWIVSLVALLLWEMYCIWKIPLNCPQLESAVMPYLTVLSDFRERVRKIAREQKGKNMRFKQNCLLYNSKHHLHVESERTETWNSSSFFLFLLIQWQSCCSSAMLSVTTCCQSLEYVWKITKVRCLCLKL